MYDLQKNLERITIMDSTTQPWSRVRDEEEGIEASLYLPLY